MCLHRFPTAISRNLPLAAGACKRLHINLVTDDEAFKQALIEARTALFQAGMHRVQALASEAIDTLEALMGRTVPPTNPRQPREMTPEEFAAWSERLRPVCSETRQARRGTRAAAKVAVDITLETDAR